MSNKNVVEGSQVTVLWRWWWKWKEGHYQSINKHTGHVTNANAKTCKLQGELFDKFFIIFYFLIHLFFPSHFIWTSLVDTSLNAWTHLTRGGVLKYCEYETCSSVYSILCNMVANTDKFTWWQVYTLTSSWTWFQAAKLFQHSIRVDIWTFWLLRSPNRFPDCAFIAKSVQGWASACLSQ